MQVSGGQGIIIKVAHLCKKEITIFHYYIIATKGQYISICYIFYQYQQINS